ADLGEPRFVGRGVEGPLEPTGDFRPQALRSQLDLTFHAARQLLAIDVRRPSIGGGVPRCKGGAFTGFSLRPHNPPQVWTRTLARTPCAASREAGLWTTRWTALVYTDRPHAVSRRVFLPLCIFLEADLPAQ